MLRDSIKISCDVKTLCVIAQVSKSCYYKWLKYFGDKGKDWGDYLIIKEIFEKNRKKSGWRQIKMCLLLNHNLVMNQQEDKEDNEKVWFNS